MNHDQWFTDSIPLQCSVLHGKEGNVKASRRHAVETNYRNILTSRQLRRGLNQHPVAPFLLKTKGSPSIIAPGYHCAPLADRDEDKLAIISRRPPLGLLDGTRPFP
jgi:hypothetical protein